MNICQNSPRASKKLKNEVPIMHDKVFHIQSRYFHITTKNGSSKVVQELIFKSTTKEKRKQFGKAKKSRTQELKALISKCKTPKLQNVKLRNQKSRTQALKNKFLVQHFESA